MINSDQPIPVPASPHRRASDRRSGDRRSAPRRNTDLLRPVSWDEQRVQFIARYLFAAFGFAYFNSGDAIARSAEYLVAANAVQVVYLVLVTIYLVHARLQLVSRTRLRVAMWTDVIAVSAAIFCDANVMSPAYLVYLVIVLGNGMRYGLRAFGEAALTSLLLGMVVLGLRFADYLQNVSVASFFFILFVAIIVAYSYSLMVNIERAREGLEVASHNDALTGLLNRRGLQEHTEALFKSLGSARAPLAVLFADLDGFKAVNDVHGHDAGDRVLKEVARGIATSVRSSDLVARFGGDEFIVLMPETTLERAATVAQRLQAIVAAAGNHQTALSVTIGVGAAPEHGADLDSVLKSVDTAMYEGKVSTARGRVCRAMGAAPA